MKLSPNGTAVMEPGFGKTVPRYNANKKQITNLLDSVKVNFTRVGSSMPIVVSGKATTQPDAEVVETIREFHLSIAKDATASSAEMTWGHLPKYSTYVDLDELYDVDEIEDLYMRAARKRGW